MLLVQEIVRFLGIFDYLIFREFRNYHKPVFTPNIMQKPCYFTTRYMLLWKLQLLSLNISNLAEILLLLANHISEISQHVVWWVKREKDMYHKYFKFLWQLYKQILKCIFYPFVTLILHSWYLRDFLNFTSQFWNTTANHAIT